MSPDALKVIFTLAGSAATVAFIQPCRGSFRCGARLGHTSPDHWRELDVVWQYAQKLTIWSGNHSGGL